MNPVYRHFAVSALALAILSGCAATEHAATAPSAANQTPVSQVELATPPVASEHLTMKQIMANPDWMGIFARNPYWSDDAGSVLFERQPSASALKSYYVQALDGEARELSLGELHQVSQRSGVLDKAKKRKAYIYQGNLFVKELSTGEVAQLTRTNTPVDGVRFLDNGDLAFWQGNAVFRLHANGMVEQLADIRMSNAPKGVKAPEAYLAKEQAKLIQYVAAQHDKAKAREDYKKALAEADTTMTAQPWYLGESEVVVELSLSADGRYVLVSLQDKSYQGRSEHDIMPNYLGKDGYVDAVPARARVAEDNPPGQRLVLIDLKDKQKHDISIEGLQGFDEDVLAAVKADNAKARGESYQSEKAPRKVQLMQDWGWSQSAIQWSDDGKLLVMLEAVDNKDRWIASVNLDSGKLTTEHRLHDDAWVNYDYNQFGWLEDGRFFFLSEETGYSQLYIKAPGKAATALTSGQFVVSDVTLSPDGKHLYYKANKDHPGVYNVYRVALADGKDEQLTHWEGTLDYSLSPDGKRLLLTASSRIQPEELYVQEIGGELKRLTHYTSEVFAKYTWQAPNVVAVPSNHGAGVVYARVYLPEGYDAAKADKYPAVIFNHGAGYLQNAHFGFSGYFREFMFHNLLAQQGYVVMDMDYRGSKGYGRDWRTAIYRQMGHPEVEDLKDGVAWMVKNANVDSKRVGTYGGSYGGFLTFMALFREPELFQAGAALRPVTDWAHYNAPYTSNILNTPDVDPIAFERSSPIYHAEGLNKPLLIMSGVLDDNVFFQDSVRLVQRLIELEKPMFETAIYPVEPHGFREPSSWLDEYRRIYKLFEAELK
ncbi:prolyl oligopeptidase family serine peptidase [Shewanella amazonensis]|uniref:Dipeptidyl peptidase IV, putative n=1 Tax=Shewanella amazonensis (strain ATCC BAA-1098 / SB2B) TaxID=326297 RepID=A1SA10_SHEAM|nr:prolyl oligopeptidase family serine peptidase [Shewanella amazonensis]ABM01217.1 dipeptidyl peptidase IV, putative [Shewanella amazonensis SB2B]